MGVTQKHQDNQVFYECVIHIRGNVLVGRYPDKVSAAIAYNKAVDILSTQGIQKKYIKNYINSYSAEEYHNAYQKIKISKKLTDYGSRAKIKSDSDK